MSLFWCFIGILATIFSVVRMVPQLIKIIKTKSAKDISKITQILSIIFGLIIFLYGLLSVIYGDHTKNAIIEMFPLIVGNLLIASLGLCILIAKLSINEDKHPRICLENEYVKLQYEKHPN